MGKPGISIGIDWDAQPLGQVTDAELAKKLNIKNDNVSAARRQRNIPFKSSHADWDKQPLGKMSDAALARILKMSRSTVSSCRRGRKIPAYGINKTRCDVCNKKFKQNKSANKKYCSEQCSNKIKNVKKRHKYLPHDLALARAVMNHAIHEAQFTE